MDGLILSGARELEQSVLFDRAARAASGFVSLGIGENDAVALVLG
jgi:long-chain acyl-CoA synthetase